MKEAIHFFADNRNKLATFDNNWQSIFLHLIDFEAISVERLLSYIFLLFIVRGVDASKKMIYQVSVIEYNGFEKFWTQFMFNSQQSQEAKRYLMEFMRILSITSIQYSHR